MRLISALLFTSLFTCLPAYAGNIEVSHAWLRLPMPGQPVAAAYLTITSQQDATLVSASSPAAGETQIHDMRIDSAGVMHMQAIPKLNLPAHQAVSLAPGGKHIMLMNLKQTFHVGEHVPLVLDIETTEHATAHIPVDLEVREAGH